MKVVLATAPEAVMTKNHVPPLGILYVASALEKKGFDVVFIDATAEKLDIDCLVERIIKADPVACGVTGTTENRFNVLKLLSSLKKRNNRIFTFWGGPHATLTYREILENIDSVDMVVRGEGEQVVPEMLERYSTRASFKDIPGLAFRDEKGEVIETAPPSIINDIDSLPWPARHLLDLARYSCDLESGDSTPAVGVISTRGCPNDCVFCANVALGCRTLRKRSPNKFVDEIEDLHKNYGFKAFDIWDDTLTIDRRHIEDICREIIERNLKISWRSRARVNTVDRPLLKLMSEAGCVSIGFGIESGSEAVLRKIRKNISTAQAKEAVRNAASLGLRVRNFFIFSLPGETLFEIRKTIDLMKELDSYGANIQNSYGFAKIYPGTELEKEALSQGILSEDFSWLRYQEFPKARLLDSNPTVPVYENRDLSLEEIKSFVLQQRYSKSQLIKKAISKIKSIKSPAGLRALLSFARTSFIKYSKN
ncbi:MAG: cobalamin B12-binding domain-containing protein [Candidatus Omnitrophica bacterium]|nr:cobalamin B12-binding domain-containing protein [Candidatus Omnitrophota bacterium]